MAGQSTQGAERIEGWLSAALAAALDVPAHSIDRNSSFHALGVDSVTSVEIAGDLEAWLGRDVPLTAFFTYPSISRLAAALAAPPRSGKKRPNIDTW